MFSFIFGVFSATSAFLYPAYSSYKALSKRPTDEGQLERWTMYWSVLAGLLTVEHLMPLVFWLPFYSFFRMLFLLYLVIPQIQGSTYIYQVYLRPLLSEHEREIDTWLERSQAKLLTKAKKWIGALWDKIMNSLAAPQGDRGAAGVRDNMPVAPEHPVNAAQPPTLNSPVAGMAQLAGGLWRTYGPTIIATGTNMIQNQQRRAAQGYTRLPDDGPTYEGPPQGSSSSTSVRNPDAAAQGALNARRPASLTPGGGGPAFPIPQTNAPNQPSIPSPSGTGSASNSGDESLSGSRRYDNISRDEVADVQMPRPEANRGTSWFGWGSPASQGYERVKSD